MARYLLTLNQRIDQVAMKNLVLLLSFLVFGASALQAQGDIPTTRPLKIGENNNLDIKSSNQGTSLRIPSVIDENLTSKNNTPEVKMLPDRNLKQAGFDLKIRPRFLENYDESKVSELAGGDIHFGDVNTKSNAVQIIIRDFGRVDGDRIRLFHDQTVVYKNILLSGAFKKVNATLQEGFNLFEFEALNQGEVGYNTAQFVIIDAENKVLYNNFWNLRIKDKASIIVVKEAE